MSKIPTTARFGYTGKSNSIIASTPLGNARKIAPNSNSGHSSLKFGDRSDISGISNNSEVSLPVRSNRENVPLKRAASQIQNPPAKVPKIAPKAAVSKKIAPLDFKAKFNDTNMKYENLQSEFSILSEVCRKHEDNLAEYDEETKKLKEENANQSDELRKLTSDNNKLVAEVSKITNERERLSTALNAANDTLSNERQQNNDLNQAMLNTQNELMLKSSELTSLKSLLDVEIRKSLELSMKVEESNIKLTSMSSNMTLLTSTKNMLVEQFNESTATIARIKNELEQSTQRIASLESQLKQLQNDLNVKTKEYNEVMGSYNLETVKNKNLETALTSCQLNIANYMNELVDNKNYSELLRMKNEDQTKEIQRLNDQNEEMQKIIEAMHDNQKTLRNQVQDLKGHIRVYCRIRPILSDENTRLPLNIDIVDSSTLNLEKICGESNSGLSKKQSNKHNFTFDGIFSPNSSQIEIFEEVSAMVQSALDGYNVCIFAYGQTGSGKTYTMEGNSVGDNSGIIPRAVDMIFASIPHLNKVGWEFTISASFLEIYNETIYDLLDSSREQGDHSIKLVDGKGPDVYVSNLKEEVVRNSVELMKLLSISQKNRQTAATLCNERSSRSHSIAKIKIVGTHATRGEKLSSCVNLIDLAGSESGKTTQRMDETKSINKSLSELSKVIIAIQSKQSHVPFRNSKLTFLLMPSLIGNSKTLMLVNVSQFDECYLETVNSLRFATQVNTCKTGSTKKNITTIK